jgi:hypothetical protein
MLYSSIVKKRIRQAFDQVNNHRWDELMGAITPDVHHRFGTPWCSFSGTGLPRY